MESENPSSSSLAPVNPLEDQASPKLLPRVSISNIKSPSKRHVSQMKTPADTITPSNMLDFLPELKQYLSFFNIHFYYQKSISDQETQLKLRYTRLHQTLITLEQRPAKQQSSQAATQTQSASRRPRANSSILMQPGQAQSADGSGKSKVEDNEKAAIQLVVELFDLFRETISRPELPSNILKGTLRTVSKLLEYKQTLVQLLLFSSSADSGRGFKPGPFLKTMFECQFDTHDTYQEEIILLTIQKIVIQVTKNFSDLLTSDEIFKNCVYFFRVLKKRAINDLQITSMHMQEGTKANMNKLFSIVMRKQDPVIPPTIEESKQEDTDEAVQKYTTTKHKLFAMFARKVLKNIKKMNELNQRPGGAVESDLAGIKGYVCFIVKAFSESFAALARSSNQNEVKNFILSDKEILFQVMCVAGEFQDIVVRSMAQLLFSQVLQKVLELEIPFREEIEVLYVKLLLKPLEQLDLKVASQGPALNQSLTTSQNGAQDKDKMQMSTESQAAAMGEVSFLSDEEDNAGADDNRITGQPALVSANSYDPNQVLYSFELDACLNTLIDTLLSLQPDHLAQLFLVYDCQPLSENLIRRSLHLILKHSQNQGKHTDLTKCYSAIGLIMRSLLRYQGPSDSKKQQKIESQSARGMQSILDMLAQKNKARNIAKKANVKPKAFFEAILETYEGLNQEQVCRIACKVLMNSRRVSLDKIAEIIGGKDDRSKMLLTHYLERQDYSNCSIEQSLRGFMQTFRMAGVDSQVVENIMEKFGDKYYERDHMKTFASASESLYFAYAIIGLQTVQHNACIKDKTTLERFFSQAKEMAPESYDKFPEGMVEAVYHKVSQHEIKAPVTRDLVAGDYDLNCGQFEIDIRTINAPRGDDNKSPLSDNDFLSMADLRETQLFDRNNSILGIAPESLQLAALRQIVNILTAKFCKIRQTCGDSRFNQYRTLELTKKLIEANGHFKNNDWVDRLMLDFDRQVEAFCRFSKLEDERKNSIKADLQNLFWCNFKSLELATGLIPKMAPSMSRSNIHYSSFNAVETKIRNKFNKEVPEAGLITRILEETKSTEESKTVVIDATKATVPVTITPRKQQEQGSSPDPKRLSPQQPSASTPRQQNSGIFNMVYNYFTPVPTEAEEEAKKREYITSGQNQIDLLKHQLDDFNKNAKSEVFAFQGPENVNDSYFFDFLVTKGIETSDALKQIALFVKENMNSRKATLCLSYLYRVYLDSQTSQDRDTSLQVRYTILQLCQSLAHHITRRESESESNSATRRQQYGHIPLSTQEGEHSDSGQDNNDSISQMSDSTADMQMMVNQGKATNLAKTMLREPRRSQFEMEIAMGVNKHLALELYFTVIGTFIVSEMTEENSNEQQQQTDTRQTSAELIKDVQKTLTALSEDELTRDDFEQAFLYDKVAEFIKPQKTLVKTVSSNSLIEDEGTQKPNETTIVEESKRFSTLSQSMSQNSQESLNPFLSSQQMQQVLPLREYPKIGKFLRLLIILMLQVNVKVSNKDQLQVSLVRLLRSLSDMFLVQELVPYDQINLSLDVLAKHCHPFRVFHDLSEVYLENMLAICQMFFQLLERGSDGQEQKLFQKGKFDLWFKTMSVMIQKILLSPYIELYKSIQERCCTLVKIQILFFQFQPLTTATGEMVEQGNQLRNYTKVIFEELVFTLSIAQLQNQRDWLSQEVGSNAAWMQRYKAGWEDEHDGFAQLCQLCANTLTDVFIQYAQSMAQEPDQKEESFEMFSNLWNKFMLVLLNYADSTESLLIENTEVHTSVQPLQQSIQDNIQRVMEFLLSQKLLLERVPEGDESAVSRAKVQLYSKTKVALGLFWQEVQISNSSQQD